MPFTTLLYGLDRTRRTNYARMYAVSVMALFREMRHYEVKA